MTAARPVSAMPMPVFAPSHSGLVAVACERGEPNCENGSGGPKSCGGPGNPCVADGGVPDCQNASSCGLDDTGHENLNAAPNMPGVTSDAIKHSGNGANGPPATGPVAPKAQ